jgi:hypothetical protein
MSRRRRLLSGTVGPICTLALSVGFAQLAHVPVGAAALSALFVFSCVLVGLAQQTLP